MILTEVCGECRNYFDVERKTGDFKIVEGAIIAPFLKPNQYYRIIGSIFNDGVHKFGDEDDVLTDENFHGAVWALAIPKAFLQLVDEVTAWKAKYEKVDSIAMSPYTSETMGPYSYNKGARATGSKAKNDTLSWTGVFGAKLAQWRKI